MGMSSAARRIKLDKKFERLGLGNAFRFDSYQFARQRNCLFCNKIWLKILSKKQKRTWKTIGI